MALVLVSRPPRPRPIVQDQDQDHDRRLRDQDQDQDRRLRDQDQDQDLRLRDQDQDQDHEKVASSGLEAETLVSKRHSLIMIFTFRPTTRVGPHIVSQLQLKRWYSDTF